MDDLDAFMRIVTILQQIDRGAGFCEDRSFGWTLDMEEREGRSLVAKSFRDHPGLAALMPELAAQLESGLPLGDISSGDILKRTGAALRAMPSIPATP